MTTNEQIQELRQETVKVWLESASVTIDQDGYIVIEGDGIKFVVANARFDTSAPAECRLITIRNDPSKAC